MHATAPFASPAPNSKGKIWTGYVLSGLVVALLLFSAIMKLLKPAGVLTEFGRLGYPESVITAIGVLEAAVALLYAFPRTAVLGAILVTGYLGGATATHVRIGDAFIMPVLLGAVAWLGLYLREPRLGPLVPIRK